MAGSEPKTGPTPEDEGARWMPPGTLVRCPDCGREYEEPYDACPACGCDLTETFAGLYRPPRTLVVRLAAVLILLFALATIVLLVVLSLVM